MSLKNWVNNTFRVSIDKIYHRSIFTIGLVTLFMMNLLTTKKARKRQYLNSLRDYSKVSEETRTVTK